MSGVIAGLTGAWLNQKIDHPIKRSRKTILQQLRRDLATPVLLDGVARGDAGAVERTR